MTAGELEAYLHSAIPLSGLMGVRVEACGDGRIVLTAPLSTNHNHLGTAFGGSLATVATLAGYCALWVALGRKDAHVVIRKSSMDYLRPVTGDIRAVCEFPAEATKSAFLDRFEKHGKARMELDVSISENGEQCLRFQGEFVALS